MLSNQDGRVPCLSYNGTCLYDQWNFMWVVCGKEDCEYTMLLLRTFDLLVKGSIDGLRNNTL